MLARRFNLLRLNMVLLGLLCQGLLFGQDPFFLQFTNTESFFNPSLTGFRGAMSVSAKYKGQWNQSGSPGFQTISLDLEESLPCSFFDYGLHVGTDQEGAGLLRTTDFGGRMAGTIAFDAGYSSHNLRFGLAMMWASKRVDYSRLVFSDQLDPKYGTSNNNGTPNATSFVPYNDGRSLWFIQPAVGFSHRILLNRQRFRSPTMLYGLAIHNAFSFGKRDFSGNIESILEQDTRLPLRWHGFLSTEFVLTSKARTVVTFRPLIAYQQQGPIHYSEFGGRLSVNRNLAVGLAYHTNFHSQETPHNNTDWYSIQLEFGGIVQRSKRIDLGLAYAGNLTGLRNGFGPILEISLAVHFASSPSCSLWGYADEVPYGDQIKCPTSTLTPGRRKMYESIWYQ